MQFYRHRSDRHVLPTTGKKGRFTNTEHNSIADDKEMCIPYVFSICKPSYVADPGWLSRIPDPDFYPSQIPDPKTVPKERDEKKFFYHTFFCSHKFHKIEYYVIFEMLKKKICANFQRIVEVFTQKIFNMLSNIWVWDPGSAIGFFRIPNPGVKKAPDPDPQHCYFVCGRDHLPVWTLDWSRPNSCSFFLS